MRLTIENLATSTCQVALIHAKDMELRRVDYKFPCLEDFGEIVYCMIDLQNRFKEQKEKCRALKRSYMQFCEHYFELIDSLYINMMA